MSTIPPPGQPLELYGLLDPYDAEGHNRDVASVVVDRNWEKDIQMRDLYVSVDDQPERTLQFGDSTEWSLPQGEHKLKITNRLFSKSASFEIQDDERIHFIAANLWLKGIFAPLSLIAGCGPYRVELKKA